jgi:hypothetical protein
MGSNTNAPEAAPSDRGGRGRGGRGYGRLGPGGRGGRDRSDNPSDDDADEGDYTFGMGEEKQMSRRYGGGGSTERVMKTYVNARKCSSVSGEKRGVLAVADGRFAVSTEASRHNAFIST